MFTALIKIGVWEWRVTSEDEPDYGPTAPVSISRSIGDGDLWPPHPEPATATFGMITRDHAGIPGIDIGNPVIIDIDGYDTFHGRISDIETSPHALGVVWTITAADYTADLAETVIGDDPWPAEYHRDRVARIFAAAGEPAPTYGYLNTYGDRVFDTNPVTAARDVDAQPVLDLIVGLTDEWPLTNPFAPVPGRYVLNAVIDPATGQRTGWQLDPVMKTLPNDWHPAVFGQTPNGWGIVPTHPYPGVTTGHYVDQSAQWRRTKATVPDEIVVSGVLDGLQRNIRVRAPWATWKPRASVTRTVALTSTMIAQELAAMFLPAAPETWTGDAFTYRRSRDPDAPPRLPALFTPRVISDIDPRHVPNGRTWWGGMVASTTVTLDGQHVTEQFTLTPLMPGSISYTNAQTNALTWDELPETPTWEDLSPVDLWNELDLIRKAT